MKVWKRAAMILLAAVLFLSGCSSMIDDIDLEAVRVPIETRPKDRPSYDKSSEEDVDENTRRRSTGIVKYQIPGDSAFYILDANTPSEDTILDFDFTGMTETKDGPVLFYAYQALYYSSDKSGLGGQAESGTAPKKDTENYLDRRKEKNGDLFYGACGYHIDKKKNTSARMKYITNFTPYKDIDTDKEEYINASEKINTIFMCYCPATRKYEILYHSTENYKPAIKRLLTSTVAATGSKSGSFVAQIPDFVTHELINRDGNRSYTFYYRGMMRKYDSTGKLVFGPKDITEHLDRLSEKEKDDDIYKEMTLVDATMDTQGTMYISVLMEDPNISSKGEDLEEKDLKDEGSSATQWTLILNDLKLSEKREIFEEWATKPEDYSKRPLTDKSYFTAQNLNAEAQKANFLRIGKEYELGHEPSQNKMPAGDVYGAFTYFDASSDIALYTKVVTKSRSSRYETTPLYVADLERYCKNTGKNNVKMSYRFIRDIFGVNNKNPLYYIYKTSKRVLVGMFYGAAFYRPRYERISRTYDVYWYETVTSVDEKGNKTEKTVRRSKTVTETMDIAMEMELHFPNDCSQFYRDETWGSNYYLSLDLGTCEMNRDAATNLPFRNGLLRVVKKDDDEEGSASLSWNDYYTNNNYNSSASKLRDSYALQGDYNYGMMDTVLNQLDGGVALWYPGRQSGYTMDLITNKSLNFAVGEGDSYSMRLEELGELVKNKDDEEITFSSDSLLDLHDEQAVCHFVEDQSGRWVIYAAGACNGLVKSMSSGISASKDVSQVTPCTTFVVRKGNQSETKNKLWLIGFTTTEFTYDTADLPCAQLYKMDPYGAEECANMAVSYLIRNPGFVKKWDQMKKNIGINGSWADLLLVNDYKEFLTEGEKNQLAKAKRFFELIGLDWPGDNTNASIPAELLACQYPVDLENFAAKLRPDLNSIEEEVEVTEESYEIREHESSIEHPTNPANAKTYTIADDVTIAETDPEKESERADRHDAVYSAVSNVRKNLLTLNGNMDADEWVQELNEIAYGLQIPTSIQDFYLKKAVLLYTAMAKTSVDYDIKNFVAEFKNRDAIEEKAIWTQEEPFEAENMREIQRVRILNELKQDYENKHGKDSWSGSMDQILLWLERGGFLSGLKSSAKRLERDAVSEDFGEGQSDAENVDLTRKIRESDNTEKQ